MYLFFLLWKSDYGIPRTYSFVLSFLYQYKGKYDIIVYESQDPIAHQVVNNILSSDSQNEVMQFLLDCSVIPEVINCVQQHGSYILNDLFYVGRTWCFSIHCERMKRLCKWNFRWSISSWFRLHLRLPNKKHLYLPGRRLPPLALST